MNMHPAVFCLEEIHRKIKNECFIPMTKLLEKHKTLYQNLCNNVSAENIHSHMPVV